MGGLLIAVVLGLLIGSFLNAWIYRMEIGKSVFSGRSRCPSCGKILGPLELIPLVSYFIQKGRCKGCKSNIPVQYAAIEAVTGALFALTYLVHKDLSASAFRDFVFIGALLVIFVFDLKHSLIPDQVVIGAAVGAFFWNFLLGMQIQSLLFGAVFGGGFFLFQYLISRGRWIGAGDIRVGVMMGAMLGPPLTLVALFISYISGALIGIFLLARGKAKFGSTIPFGTFLTVGTTTALFFGDRILSWYLNQLGL